LRDTAPPALFSEYQVDSVYDLSNFRRDTYKSHDFTVRKAFRGEYMLMASYIRSPAMSNAVADTNIDDPVSYSDTFGPMPWDTPNRLMTWGYLPLPRKNWAVAYLLEWRDGFPFSVHDDDGRSVGAANSRRMPDYFNLICISSAASCSATSAGLAAAVSTTSRTVRIQRRSTTTSALPASLPTTAAPDAVLDHVLRVGKRDDIASLLAILEEALASEALAGKSARDCHGDRFRRDQQHHPYRSRRD
jgi:hypothetical protein